MPYSNLLNLMLSIWASDDVDQNNKEHAAIHLAYQLNEIDFVL